MSKTYLSSSIMVVSRANGVSGSKTNAEGEGEGKNDSCNTMKGGRGGGASPTAFTGPNISAWAEK